MQQPLVLAIEPDHRQAAIVKRIVREKVLAEVAVVDSRDAALDAMRTTVPDVLLLSALLSPRDEDELIAHLRTLQNAEHLQTHTIPQLASSIGQDDDKPKGLLSAFRRKKGSAGTTAGCDPDLFADEIRNYLQRASEKKRELRESASRGPVVSPAIAAAPASGSAGAAAPKPSSSSADADAPTPESSWSSPFEWRPTVPRTVSTETRPEPEPAAAAVPEAAAAVPFEPEPEPFFAKEPVAEPEPFVMAAPEPVAVVAVPEPVIAAPPEPVFVPEPEPVFVAAPEPVIAAAPAPVVVVAPEPVVVARPHAVRRKLPLVKRHKHEWWFEDHEPARRGDEVDSELREVLASLSIPFHVASMAYAEGCRIRRVRLTSD